jgi:hypothetical protein
VPPGAALVPPVAVDVLEELEPQPAVARARQTASPMTIGDFKVLWESSAMILEARRLGAARRARSGGAAARSSTRSAGLDGVAGDLHLVDEVEFAMGEEVPAGAAGV